LDNFLQGSVVRVGYRTWYGYAEAQIDALHCHRQVAGEAVQYPPDSFSRLFAKDLQNPFMRITVIDNNRQVQLPGHPDESPKNPLLIRPGRTVTVEIKPYLADCHHLVNVSGKFSNLCIALFRNSGCIMRMDAHGSKQVRMFLRQLGGLDA